MRPGPSSSEPNTASELSGGVREALRTGDAAAAIALCEAAVARLPDDAEPHRHLSVLLAASGRRVAAIRAGRLACELAPRDPRAWSDLGRAHALLSSLDEAASCFLAAVRLDERHADGWHNLGAALVQLGRFEKAFTALKNALAIDPARADTYVELGNLLIESGQLGDARECFERATKHDPAMARARSRLGEILSGHGDPGRAGALFRESLSLDPDHVEGWIGLGRALEDLGNGHGALSCYRNALARQPGHAAALGSYLALLEAEAPPGMLQAARSAVEDPKAQDEARALIGYGLTKYHDRHSQYGEAAWAASAANAARRRTSGPLDREALLSRVDGLIESCDAAFFARRRGYGMATEQPVFIVGMPRSGTTLTEQIIDAHPLLHGAGELQDLARLARQAAANAPAWQAASLVDAERSRALAQEYLRALRDGAPRQRLRISDKAPLNFFQLAFAAVLFPNARVIHCRRTPADNALSIWMENFNAEQRYATDFGDLAFHFEQHDRLMAHWRATLPLRTLEVRYEDTVANVDAQARRIMEFLDVPWDRRCLDFHSSGRAVQTPSRWQVRQPIYSRSVERWRQYRAFLPDLRAAFTGATG